MKLFQSKKTKIALAAELIMPWLVLIGSIPAVFYWQKSYEEWRIEYNGEAYLWTSEIFDLFFKIAMITGAVVIALEVIISLVSLVLMIISITKRTKCVTYTMLVLFLCAALCILVTGMLMFLTLVFTYGMGV